MELAINNKFCEMSKVDTELVNAGGWPEFGYATIGTLCIASAPIAVASGQPFGAVALVGTGLYMYGNL